VLCELHADAAALELRVVALQRGVHAGLRGEGDERHAAAPALAIREQAARLNRARLAEGFLQALLVQGPGQVLHRDLERPRRGGSLGRVLFSIPLLLLLLFLRRRLFLCVLLDRLVLLLFLRRRLFLSVLVLDRLLFLLLLYRLSILLLERNLLFLLLLGLLFRHGLFLSGHLLLLFFLLCRGFHVLRLVDLRVTLAHHSRVREATGRVP